MILLRLIGRRSFPQSALRRFILNERRVSSARNARWCPSQSSAAQDQLSRCSLNILTILTIMYPIYCYVLCIVSNGVLALHLIIRCWCGSWYFRRRCRRGFVCWCWWCLCCRRDGISFTCDAFGKRCSPPAEPAFLRFSHCKQMAEEGEKNKGKRWMSEGKHREQRAEKTWEIANDPPDPVPDPDLVLALNCLPKLKKCHYTTPIWNYRASYNR